VERGGGEVKKILNNVLGEIEVVLGKYAPAIETDCPAWALSLKEAEVNIIDAIEKIDFGEKNEQLDKLWQEFILWENGENGSNDDEAERYAEYKGASNYQVAAFRAYVEGRAETQVKEDRNVAAREDDDDSEDFAKEEKGGRNG
jgi:hypothetical protein